MASKTCVEHRKTAEASSNQHPAIDHADVPKTIRQINDKLKLSLRTRSSASMSASSSEDSKEKGTAHGDSCNHETLKTTFATSSEQQRHANLETNRSPINILVEVDKLKEIRKNTFSHWPHRAPPSAAQMIKAGFFCCNFGDRVICIYCNLISQQWTPQTDDPWEVHKTLSPKCPYAIAMLNTDSSSNTPIMNEESTAIDQFSQIPVHTTACNPNYIEIPKRLATFASWPNENLPSADGLVRAGFFYSGMKSIVTCFYCNGSLQNWSANDNPMIEHIRWYPHCAYARQLCGPDLCRKIQEATRAQQGLLLGNDNS